MKVHVLCFTDGRKGCFARTLSNFTQAVHGDYTMTIVNDEPSADYVQWLEQSYGRTGMQIINHQARRGFSGAIDTGWGAVPAGTTHVFHLEDDFLFQEPVYLSVLADILDEHPHVVQVAYKRQPWNSEEKAAGGIVELHPDDFEEDDSLWGKITTHRRFFTTNPSMYRAELTKRGWPQVEHSEGIFTHQMLEDPELRFAFLGGKFDAPRVMHIGKERVGLGY